MSKLVPKYKLIEAIDIAITLATRALEEIRTLARTPGPPGKDGLGFDDLTMEYDGERTFSFVLQKGDITKRFDFVAPINIDRGVFKDGSSYLRGDGVSYGGSYWIAQKDTAAKPGIDSAWRLAVKKGRDAKDAVAVVPPAKVKKASDQTAANYTAGAAVAFDTELADTDGFHDNSTNNSRLTIPSGLGIKRVDVALNLYVSSHTSAALIYTHITKGGSTTYDGFATNDNTNAAVTRGMGVVGKNVDATAGDYFEAFLGVATDTSITVESARTTFSLEVTEIDAQGFIAYRYGAIEIEKVGTDEWIVVDQTALG